MTTALIDIHTGKKARVVKLVGGYGLQRRLRVLGIMEGKVIKVLTIQPFRGPIVIEIEGKQTTLGRGIAERVLVEAIA
jgi:ferrous iron transport protein A